MPAPRHQRRLPQRSRESQATGSSTPHRRSPPQCCRSRVRASMAPDPCQLPASPPALRGLRSARDRRRPCSTQQGRARQSRRDQPGRLAAPPVTMPLMPHIQDQPPRRRVREPCHTPHGRMSAMPPTSIVPCTYCGLDCEKPTRMLKTRRPFCSLICRDLWKLDNGVNMPPVPQPRSCPLPWDHPARAPQSTPVAYGHCPECASLHCSPAVNPRTYCSTTCRNRARYRRRPSRTTRKATWRTAIFQRDAWTCWLCGGHTDPTATVPHPLAPTVDHLVPRIDGGTDDPSNLATAHLSCNSRRGRSLNNLTLEPPHAA